MFDGMEISQFTYFQQAGGLELSPISAELTYGLERIAMVLQRVDSIYDLEWAPGVTYRDVRLPRRGRAVEIRVRPGRACRRSSSARFTAICSRSTSRWPDVLLKSGLVMAGARAVPEVLAPVQRARREQQHRRHRADRLHPARAAARRRHRQGLDRSRRGRTGRRATRDRLSGSGSERRAGAHIDDGS